MRKGHRATVFVGKVHCSSFGYLRCFPLRISQITAPEREREMGFGDALNWMADKLKQSAPVMTPVGKACRGSYDLGCAAVSEINNGAQKLKGYCPDSQSAINAAAYAFDVVMTESLRRIPGGSILCRFAQDGLHSFHGRMRSKHETNTIKDLQNRIQELEEDVKFQAELNKLLLGRYNYQHHPVDHWGPNMEQKPEDVFLGSNMGQKPEDVSFGSKLEQKPEDVIKTFLMGGFSSGVILAPLVVSLASEIEKR